MDDYSNLSKAQLVALLHEKTKPKVVHHKAVKIGAPVITRALPLRNTAHIQDTLAEEKMIVATVKKEHEAKQKKKLTDEIKQKARKELEPVQEKKVSKKRTAEILETSPEMVEMVVEEKEKEHKQPKQTKSKGVLQMMSAKALRQLVKQKAPLHFGHGSGLATLKKEEIIKRAENIDELKEYL
jgi:hypothetical protein